MSKDAKPVETPLDSDMDCRGCGSASRTPYLFIRSEPIDGNLIAWKRTQCKTCGQHRINRFGSPLPAPQAQTKARAPK